MIVQCEKCGTKYRIDDSKVGAKGIKVRCSKCQHVFKVPHPLLLDEEEIFGETEERVEGPSVKEWEEEFTMKPPPEQIKTRPPTPEEGPPPKAFVPPAAQEKKVLREEGAAEEGLSSEEELFPFRASVPEEAPVKKERKISRTFLLSILLIVIILAAFYYWTQREVSIPVFESIYKKIYHFMGSKAEHKLLLLYPRRYELRLEGGKVFVIQGKVTNHSEETKKYVKLKGFLFNKEGRIVATSIGYCGHTITKKEIEESTYTSLKSSFGFVSSAKAAPVPSQRSPSFTIIFFSPPVGVTECKVEIVEAPPLT
ncbi:MAG: zinc-ribbon domain-containing protein [Deltaproteobacteria bacterium]|nr:zinc-ribbon domain-containing protein [Deltaproteobacteria bacterium]